ncbi:MAG: M13 family metallopeptidase [Steroidobacteraceae bacterium]
MPRLDHCLNALCLLALSCVASADDQGPLREFPYTPGLDPAAMDREADPCEDFFQYSCGGWLKNHPIPPDRSSWEVYSKLAEDNLRYLWGLLSQASLGDDTRSTEQAQLGDFFAACMDTAAIDKLGLAPAEGTLEAIRRLRSRKELPELLARLHDGRGNGAALFGYSAWQDFESSDRYIGTFFSGGIGLPERDYYLEDSPRMIETRQRYAEHIERMWVLAGGDEQESAQVAERVLTLETALAKATLPVTDQQDPTKLNHPMLIGELGRTARGFDWKRYVELRSSSASERINATEPAFLTEVARVIDDTAIGDLRNYLTWSFLRAHARWLSTPLADESFAFNYGYLFGIQEQPPRWKTCVRGVDEDLGEALGKEFVSRTFAGETREAAARMIGTIQEVMRERISNLDWMGDSTRAKALEKLEAMRNKVGHPERWRDYTALLIEPGDYFGNRSRAAAFEQRRLLSRIGQPVDPDEWSMTPQTVNAYYDWMRNEMNFPAGVLQPPLFDLSIDVAPAWGNTGATIGHELIHGFDDAGRHFDAAGNLKDWWSEADAAAFVSQTQCLRDQYAEYVVVDDIRINSELTLGEDIADLGGLTLAYIGWRIATEEESLTEVDGLTPDQRFFVGNAQWACGHQTDERARVLARTDPHSPLRYRVNGVMVNLPEFQEAFECQTGDRMYRSPEQMCRIW